MTDPDAQEQPDPHAVLASVERARRRVFSAWMAARDDARFFAGASTDEAAAPHDQPDPTTGRTG